MESFEWYTSDLHLAHVNIGRYCGRPWGDDVDSMNAALITRWNAHVQPGDRVCVVGDLAMGKIMASLSLVADLNGRISLVPGNHDRCHPMYPDAERWRGIYEEAGVTVLAPLIGAVLQDGVPLEDGVAPLRVEVDVCHYPYHGESRLTEPDRDEDWRPLWNGTHRTLLHGHVHDHWLQRGPCLNVGTDVWNFYPVSQATLLAMTMTPADDEPNRVGRIRENQAAGESPPAPVDAPRGKRRKAPKLDKEICP